MEQITYADLVRFIAAAHDDVAEALAKFFGYDAAFEAYTSREALKKFQEYRG